MFRLFDSSQLYRAGNPPDVHDLEFNAGTEGWGAEIPDTSWFRDTAPLRFHCLHSSFHFHVFIGGVIVEQNFEDRWSAKWLELGGTSADLNKYEPRSVWRYLETLSDKSGYDMIVKLPKARHQWD